MNAFTSARSDRKTFPPLLHYIDEHGLDVLSRRELKITPPGKFNDPFEFWLGLPAGFSLDEVKALYRKEESLPYQACKTSPRLL